MTKANKMIKNQVAHLEEKLSKMNSSYKQSLESMAKMNKAQLDAKEAELWALRDEAVADGDDDEKKKIENDISRVQQNKKDIEQPAVEQVNIEAEITAWYNENQEKIESDPVKAQDIGAIAQAELSKHNTVAGFAKAMDKVINRFYPEQSNPNRSAPAGS